MEKGDLYGGCDQCLELWNRILWSSGEGGSSSRGTQPSALLLQSSKWPVVARWYPVVRSDAKRAGIPHRVIAAHPSLHCRELVAEALAGYKLISSILSPEPHPRSPPHSRDTAVSYLAISPFTSTFTRLIRLTQLCPAESPSTVWPRRLSVVSPPCVFLSPARQLPIDIQPPTNTSTRSRTRPVGLSARHPPVALLQSY
jgi:hypothetical protein